MSADLDNVVVGIAGTNTQGLFAAGRFQRTTQRLTVSGIQHKMGKKKETYSELCYSGITYIPLNNTSSARADQEGEISILTRFAMKETS